VVDSVEGATEEIKRLLEGNGLSVQSLNPIPFTMEDVFISLVEAQEKFLAEQL
jgi:hypothetical protein